ncbi:hypothetical protein DM01DRAFT_1403730 [Hesseltinella vesiculosa]|uniref:PH domain-containing protein n=1 Tax=Hesseltinella vesiculosa TaxID=101127 RepID=A0A1X2GVE8_9FUNG|nr:hypothetical protein DM01DRAFT_1403730 [Hesseltinella vesiculosa]
MIHHDYVNFLKASVVPSLINLKDDVKNFVQSIHKDPHLRSAILYDCRQNTDHMLLRLDQSARHAQHSPDSLSPQEDPTLLNLGVIQAFKTMFQDENTLQENVLQLQREVATVEQRIIGSLNVISKNWESYCVDHFVDDKEIVGKITDVMDAMPANADWNEFVRRNQFQLVNENAAYKSDKDMIYNNQSNPMCAPVKVNFLNRKQVMRGWNEGLYVLTPCGYMHGYKSAKHFETQPLHPETSIFLPNSTVTSTDEQAEDYCFQVTTGAKRTNKMHLGEKKFIFQANDAQDLANWYQAAAELSGRNACHEQFELEGVAPVMPGLGQAQQPRLLTHQEVPEEQAPTEQESDDDDSEYVQRAPGNLDRYEAPLGTASVLPSDMPSTSTAPVAPGIQARDERIAQAMPKSLVTPDPAGDAALAIPTEENTLDQQGLQRGSVEANVSDILDGQVPGDDAENPASANQSKKKSSKKRRN